MPLKDLEARRLYNRAYSRRTQQRDKERKYVHTKAWRKKNWDKHLETAKRYRVAHPDRVKASLAVVDKLPHRVEYRRQWKRDHPEKMQQINAAARLKRKLAVQKNGGRCTPEQWKDRCDFYGWRCAYCRQSLSMATVEIDHVKPVSRGGSGWPANLVPACRSCNAKKNKRLILPMWITREVA